MNKSKILVIDDEKGIRDLIAIGFSKHYEVKTAERAKEALVLIDSWKPDIVFLDIFLPDQDGLETLSEIKNKNKEVTIFIITGEGTLQRAQKAMDLGADDYILKPFNVDDLSNLTGSVLKLKKMEAEIAQLKLKLKEEKESREE